MLAVMSRYSSPDSVTDSVGRNPASSPNEERALAFELAQGKVSPTYCYRETVSTMSKIQRLGTGYAPKFYTQRWAIAGVKEGHLYNTVATREHAVPHIASGTHQYTPPRGSIRRDQAGEEERPRSQSIPIQSLRPVS